MFSIGQNNNAEFLLGGKSMGVFPMTMSLVASFMSAITLLGTPAEIYRNGTQYVFLVLAYPLVMFATAYFYMPVFYNLNVSTSYEVSIIYIMVIRVVEFSREGYKIRKVFWLKINCIQMKLSNFEN